VPLFLDALGIDRAVVAGHSGAGLVARRAALDHPARVAGIVLEAVPTTLRGHAGLEAFVASLMSDLTDPVDEAVVRGTIADTTGNVSREFVEEMVEESLKVPARVWQQTFGGLLGYDDVAELGQLTVPSLLVWGDADELVDRTMQESLLAALPAGELVVYPGIGHSPHWEDPRRFATDVAAFTRRVGGIAGVEV
jgi:pimeloyl-ACP methyl ester carboxylesterase